MLTKGLRTRLSRKNRRSSRCFLGCERLECRRLLVAEGAVFSLDQPVDTISLVGNYAAQVVWGDGTTTAATVTPGQLTSKISARIDYSLDTSGFFTTARRQLLQSVADSIVGRFSDTLQAIQPSGSNTWQATFQHPSQASGTTVSRSNLQIAENEILIFAGARPMTAPQLGEGGPGGFQASGSSAFLSTVQNRGQGTTTGASANDFGPWGGHLTINSSANWFFGNDISSIASDQHDFVTLAAHEIIHLLGFGTSAAWQRLVSGNSFTGAQSRAEFDGSGNVPLSSDRGHWQIDLADGGNETLMDPNQTIGTRKLPTPLDLGGLKDIGWTIPSTTARVTAQHTFADNGNYPIQINVTGSRLGRVESSTSAIITNAPPVLTVPASQSFATGQSFVVPNIGQISDPGFRNNSATPPTVETFTYTVNWGDGSDDQTGSATIDQIGNASRPTLASFDGTHTYQSPGAYTVRVTVRDDDGGSDTKSFTINALAGPTITIASNRDAVVEDGSVKATLTLTRSGGDVTQPLTINLVSSDLTEATVPATATFAANATSMEVQLEPADDTLLDGDQDVTVTAFATGLSPVAVDLVVRDAEFLTATVLDPEIFENKGPDAVRIRIARSNTDTDSPLSVAISGSDPALLESVSGAVIPAGSQELLLALDSTDDSFPELTKQLSLGFSAAGYAGVVGTITILDNEPPRYQNPVNILDVDGDGIVKPIDALKIINFLNRNNGNTQLDPELGLDLAFVDVTGDYIVQPLDALRVINALNRGEGEGEGERVLTVSEAGTLALVDEQVAGLMIGPITEQEWRLRLLQAELVASDDVIV